MTTLAQAVLNKQNADDRIIALESIAQTLRSDQGINRALATDIDHIVPGLITNHRHLQGYTADLSSTYYRESLESVDTAIADEATKARQASLLIARVWIRMINECLESLRVQVSATPPDLSFLMRIEEWLDYASKGRWTSANSTAIGLNNTLERHGIATINPEGVGTADVHRAFIQAVLTAYAEPVFNSVTEDCLLADGHLTAAESYTATVMDNLPTVVDLWQCLANSVVDRIPRDQDFTLKFVEQSTSRELTPIDMERLTYQLEQSSTATVSAAKHATLIGTVSVEWPVRATQLELWAERVAQIDACVSALEANVDCWPLDTLAEVTDERLHQVLCHLDLVRYHLLLIQMSCAPVAEYNTQLDTGLTLLHAEYDDVLAANTPRSEVAVESAPVDYTPTSTRRLVVRSW